MRFIRKDFLKVLVDHISHYPSPTNLNFNWGFGSLSIFYLIIQILTGILLTIYYVPNAEYAFESVQYIMRETNYGWLIRYGHTTGSSVFFAIVYFHIGRGLYYGSYYYPRILTWYTGLVVFLLMMGSAFFGYILPWGQMSLWAAIVITNLFSTIPYIGDEFVVWLWGDYSVGPATLKRFFTFHFVLPFLVLGAALVHIIKLHRVGSNNPLGRDHADYLPLYPYFFIKDTLIIFISLILFGIFMSWAPDLFIHPDNNIASNPLVTPEHIVPEWYFLPFYAILRSIPSKFLGFICMIFSILIMFLIPFIGSSQRFRVVRYHFFHKFFFFVLIADFLLLGWLGGCSIEYPYLLLSRLCTSYYFFYFFVILPSLSYFLSEVYDEVNELFSYDFWDPAYEPNSEYGEYEWTCMLEYATFCDYYDLFSVEFFLEKDHNESFFFKTPEDFEEAIRDAYGDIYEVGVIAEIYDFMAPDMPLSVLRMEPLLHTVYSVIGKGVFSLELRNFSNSFTSGIDSTTSELKSAINDYFFYFPAE